jgi:CheY-like chemotaxis protein
MESMLRRLIGEDIRLMTVLPDGLGQVMADEGQIEQVLMNLAVNARDAMPHGGTLTIETGHTLADAAYRTLHPEVVPGPQLVLSVHDTGHGMDATTLAHIFEPFFTTKEEGKGTGLGLATVYGVVKQSGGHIEVESAPGEGATFRIHLPVLENAGQPVPAPAREASLCRGSETVLLLEDDEALRSVTQEILERAGYRMIVAARPEDALASAVAYPGQIDLLLSDVILPGMNGPRFAAELLARRPEIRVLFVSGYTDDAIFKPGILEAGLRLLQKPFTAQALLQAVRAALEDPATTPRPR